MNPFVGQWENVDGSGEVLNIFDQTPPRMKQSFAAYGHFNFEPLRAYMQEEYLCWEINDEYYRMIYHVKPEDGALAGYVTVRRDGTDFPVRYALSSPVPEDAPYRYKPAATCVEAVNEPRLETLRRFARYDRKAKGPSCETSYELYAPVPESMEEYGYSRLFPPQTAPDDERAFRLLDFVCEHFAHDDANVSGGASIDSIVRFCRAHDGKTNCRGLAMLLAALLRANGIKASHVTCMPYEHPFDDCHVVVDCLLPSGKRVMLDPTMHLWYRDAADEPVSLPRLREMLISGEALFANEDASYNHEGFDPDGQREYLTKNTLRFSRGNVCADGVDGDRGKQLCLFPQGYPVDRLPVMEVEEFIFNDETFWVM